MVTWMGRETLMKPDNCRRQWFRINVRIAFCALLIAAILCPGTALLFAAHSPYNPRRILVIPSYNFDYKGIQWFLQGVMAEFNEQKPFNVTFSLENLQLAAHPSDRKYMDSMADSLKIKYSLEKPDLIIVQYKQALQFMERYGREIFGDLPVVFAGLSVEGYTPGRLHDNYTGIVASFSAVKNIELILQNHPATRKIYVVGGFSPVEQNLVTEAINEGAPYLGKVKFVALTDMTYPALLEKLRTLETDSAVMYQALQIDAAGKVFVPAQAAIEIAKASRVPVYGMLDTYMGSGITGGFLIHHEGLGRRAAKIAIDWLQSGVAPEAKVKSEPIGSYRFDERQLKRWGIEEVVLPLESKVEFKTYSVWNSYKKEIIGGVFLFLIQTILIIGLMRSRYRRIRTEEALRKSEALYRLVVENINDIIWTFDLSTMTYTFVSPSVRRILGYGDETTMKDLDVIFTPETKRHVLKLFGKFMEGNAEESVIVMDAEHRKKDGSLIWMEISASPLKDNLGNIVGFLGGTRDITKRRRAEVESAKLSAQLQQAQKMDSVGRLAGGVAHDFNNMLGVILGHAEIALDQVDPAQPLHTHLQEIRLAANRSADLTRQLLAFARKQAVSPKVLDLNDTVAGMLKMLQRLIGENLHLAWLPGADVWPVKIDPSQIDQTLVNLCVNARDAIAGVGKLTIETKNISFDEDYCANHTGFVPGEYVLLTVSDDGCGMDKETIDKIYEPFFTTKGMGKGTGLGLAMIYGIVKQNNGFINVYSEPGQGTSFMIYLPRQMRKTEQLRREESPEPVPHGQETILLVEDEPTLLELSTLLLSTQGYRVLAAGSPGEAIRLAGENAGEIHLLMTDVVMPEMNGRDLAKTLLALYPHLKCLFTSGYTANVIAHHGVLDENVHFIQKPFSRRDLAAKVRAVLDQK